MRFVFLCSLLITSGVYGYGQNQPTRANNPCLSPEQHLQIKNQLRENIRNLEQRGILSRNKRSNVVTTLSWPLRQATHANYPNYYVISNFVDHDPSAGLLDYHGGQRTYNGHMGTDIWIWPFSWIKMQNEEIEVVAASGGTIINKFDGNTDLSCDFNDPFNAWNAVYIQHPDGSVAWYGHLKKNTLTSKAIGQSVSEGEFLGYMGSSGYSSDPHLHFELYDPSGNLIDPFAGPSNGLNNSTWWSTQKPYDEPTIMRLLTGNGPPLFSNGCPANDDFPNEQSTFDAGETVYFSAFFRSEQISMLKNYKVIQPNGSVWQEWNSTSQVFYLASYWYYNYDLPPNAMPGIWRFEVSFNGDTKYVDFLVGSCPPNLTLHNTHSSGTQHIGSSSSLTSTQQVLGGTLNLHSGNLVHIQYPFSVENGAVLTIQTDGCGPY